MSLISSAIAQTPANTPGQVPVQGPNLMANLLPLALVFGVFYFLVLRPQRKQQKLHQEMLAKMAPGDEIVTVSGIYGKIHTLAEKTVVLEIAPSTRVKFSRNQIAAVVKE